MANERTGVSAQTDQENVLAERGGPSLPPALRLQILTTEHWSLLSTRALSWNEAFSRATMFLAVVDGVVAGVLLGILTMRASLDGVIGIGIAVAGALATVALQLLYQYRGVVKPRGEGSVSFPDMSSRG